MTQEPDKPLQISRLDPAFKAITRQMAEKLGLQAIETEFAQTLRADLILAVPPEVSLQNTMFDFFRAFNVVEFKSQGDRLDENAYITNEIRTDLFILQKSEATFENTLNVNVTSRYPRELFTFMKKRGGRFKVLAGKPWLRLGRVGLQDVAIVICRDLPLEELYYEWLLFAPSDSQKWRDFVTMLVREGEFALLEKVKICTHRSLNLWLLILRKS